MKRWLIVATLVALGATACVAVVLLRIAHPQAGSAATTAAGMPDCKGNELLSVSPVSINDLSTVVPLGNVAPPGHVVPTVHVYYNYKQLPNQGNFPAKTTLYVPADMTVTKIALEDNASNAHPFNSFRVDFAICKQVTGYFYHPVTLNDTLTAAIQPPYDQTQTSNVGAANPDHSYTKYVSIKLKAGDVLGTGGGAENLPDGLDFGLSDTRATSVVANRVRWNEEDRHYVCPLDYYAGDLATQLRSAIGGFDLKRVNPGEPVCGTVYQDVSGTAQGVWFASDLSPTTFWDSNGQLALVHSNLNHSLGVISIGNDAQKIGVSPNGIYTFRPANSGSVNLDFPLVKPGAVVCYDTIDSTQFNSPAGPSILAELTDTTTLKLGKLAANRCGSGPWQFGETLTYVR